MLNTSDDLAHFNMVDDGNCRTGRVPDSLENILLERLFYKMLITSDVSARSNMVDDGSCQTGRVPDSFEAIYYFLAQSISLNVASIGTKSF